MTSKKKLKVLCVETQGDWLSRMVAECLAQVPGVEAHFLIFEPRLTPPLLDPPVRFSRYAASYRHYRSSADQDLALQVIRRELAQTGCDMLLPINEEAILMVARNPGQFAGLCRTIPLPDPETMEVVTDKFRLAMFLHAHGLPAPPTISANLREDWEDKLDGLPYPVLIKPTLVTESGGGRGIRRFERAADLRAFLEKNGGKMSDYLIQELIPGSDIVCAAYCREGRMLAHSIHQPYIPSNHTYLYARSVEFVRNDRVLEAASNMFRALNWTGPANVDFRLDSRDGVPKAVEFNARFWATLEATLDAGVNYPYVACQAALGPEVDAPPFRHIRHVHQRDAVGQLRLALWGRDHYPVALRDIRLGFLLRDPMPTLMKYYYNFKNALACRLRGEEPACWLSPPRV